MPPGSVIPLHDHPGMTVFSKLLLGSMHARSYDFIDHPHPSQEGMSFSFSLTIWSAFSPMSLSSLCLSVGISICLSTCLSFSTYLPAYVSLNCLSPPSLPCFFLLTELKTISICLSHTLSWLSSSPEHAHTLSHLCSLSLCLFLSLFLSLSSSRHHSYSASIPFFHIFPLSLTICSLCLSASLCPFPITQISSASYPHVPFLTLSLLAFCHVGSTHVTARVICECADHENDDLAGRQRRLAKLTMDSELMAPCKSSVLFPEAGGNIHDFTAITPCAILDIMGPPYSAEEDRDITYYKCLPFSGRYQPSIDR